ncbi:MAG: hypothetical protein PWQ32_395 [Thermococcaceae archaeon]|nr:hypothetical protein [Thermococcaceae archaeon]MDK2854244.1 hypothetical protein [Thermococcaceae archaeon]
MFTNFTQITTDQNGNEVVLIELEDRMEILPRKKPNFSKFFDIIEVKVKGEDLEKELLECL